MDSKYEWVHELIRAEQEIEETGVIEFGSSIDPERTMVGAALSLLASLREGFDQTIEVFNQLKTNPHGRIKIYSIAKTHADFMLFRNGFKLVFSLKQPGVISIRTHFLNPTLPTVASMNFIGTSVSTPQYKGEEDLLEMTWGPFNETLWTFKNQPVRTENIVRYYLTKFIHETANPGN